MPMWFSSMYSLQSGIGSFAHAINNPANIPAPTITATTSPAMRFSFLFKIRFCLLPSFKSSCTSCLLLDCFQSLFLPVIEDHLFLIL